MKIIVVSTIDGRIRGGIRHPIGATIHEPHGLTIGQLKEIVLDPTMVVVAGQQITVDRLTDLLGEAVERWPEVQVETCSLADPMPSDTVVGGGRLFAGASYWDGVTGARGTATMPGGMHLSEVEAAELVGGEPLTERPSELHPAEGAGAEPAQLYEGEIAPAPTGLEGAAREVSTETPNENLASKRRGRPPRAEG